MPVSGTALPVDRQVGLPESDSLRREIHAAVVHVAGDAVAVHDLQQHLVLADGLDRRAEVDAPARVCPSSARIAGGGAILVAYAAQDAGQLEVAPVVIVSGTAR